MEERSVYRRGANSAFLPVCGADDKYAIAVAAPVLAEGDVLGCVLFVTERGASPLGEVEYKLAQTVSSFLGKQMES